MIGRALAGVANWLRARLFPTTWYAVRHARHRGWLVALPGADRAWNESYALEFGPALWFDDETEAWLQMVSHGLDLDEHQLVRLSVRPNSNHYRMREVSWPDYSGSEGLAIILLGK